MRTVACRLCVHRPLGVRVKGVVRADYAQREQRQRHTDGPDDSPAALVAPFATDYACADDCVLLMRGQLGALFAQFVPLMRGQHLSPWMRAAYAWITATSEVRADYA